MEIKTFFSIWKHQVQANELNNLTIQKLYNTSIVWIFCLFSLVLYVSHAQHCDLFLCIVLMKPHSGIHYEYSIWLLYGILLRVYLLIYNILTSPYNSCKFFFTNKILRWTHNSCKIFLSPKIHSKLDICNSEKERFNCTFILGANSGSNPNVIITIEIHWRNTQVIGKHEVDHQTTL